MSTIKPADVVKGYIEIEYGQLHYRRCGQGVPSILLLHATPNSSVMFNSALRRFAANGFHAIAIDLPNCGESYFTGTEPDNKYLADVVVKATRLLKFIEPFDMIGHQTGATVSLQVANDFPNSVRKIVLWGVPLLGFMQRGDLLREEPPDYDGDFHGVISTFLDVRYPTPVPWQLKVRALIDMLSTYERRPWTTRAMAVVDHEGILKTLSVPVLCMAGDNEPLQNASRKAALLCQNGKYVNLGAAGSDVVDEIPDDYVREVLTFLYSDGLPNQPRVSWSIPSERPPVVVAYRMSEQHPGSALESPSPKGASAKGDIPSSNSQRSKALRGSGGPEGSSAVLVDVGTDERRRSESDELQAERRMSGDKKRLTFRNIFKGGKS